MGMSGGGGIDEIDIDTGFVDEFKNEALTFLAEALAEGLPYAERFLNKSFNQRMSFHDQAVADFDRIFALSEPYRMQGFAAFDKLNDMYGIPRMEGGSYEMAKSLEAEAKQRGLRQRLDRMNAEFINELGVQDPVLNRNMQYLASSGMSPMGLMNAIEGVRGYDMVPRAKPFENLATQSSENEGQPAPADWKNVGLKSQQWPGFDYSGLRNSRYDPFANYMAQAMPIQNQLEMAMKQYTPSRQKTAQAIQTGQLFNKPVRRM